jgi:hypothetical protein
LVWRRKCRCGRSLVRQDNVRVCPECRTKRKECPCAHI